VFLRVYEGWIASGVKTVVEPPMQA
jgi:hypothetical protein